MSLLIKDFEYSPLAGLTAWELQELRDPVLGPVMVELSGWIMEREDKRYSLLPDGPSYRRLYQLEHRIRQLLKLDAPSEKDPAPDRVWIEAPPPSKEVKSIASVWCAYTHVTQRDGKPPRCVVSGPVTGEPPPGPGLCEMLRQQMRQKMDSPHKHNPATQLRLLCELFPLASLVRCSAAFQREVKLRKIQLRQRRLRQAMQLLRSKEEEEEEEEEEAAPSLRKAVREAFRDVEFRKKYETMVEDLFQRKTLSHPYLLSTPRVNLVLVDEAASVDAALGFIKEQKEELQPELRAQIAAWLGVPCWPPKE